MITLYGFEENFGLTDPSPFVLKAAAYMRMSEIKYTINRDAKNLQNAPKGKLPYMLDGKNLIADSQFIIEYLARTYGDNLDSHLSAEQKAIAYLITKSLDENLYLCLVYSRWLKDDTWPLVKDAFFGKMPFVLKNIVPNIIRKSVAKGLKGQGISRHSDDELLHITQSSFKALSVILGDKLFFLSDKPSSIDATCYAMLASFILAEIDNPFNVMARKYDNLVDYCHRINHKYFLNN